MSVTENNSNLRETQRRTRSEVKKAHVPCSEASMEVDEGVPIEANVASVIAQDVTEKISALMERKFSELHSTLDKLNNRIEDNSKRLTETESRISEGEDRTTSLEKRVSELERKVKTLIDRAEDNENRSRRENIGVMGLKEGAEGKNAVKFFETWLANTLGLETKRGSIKIDRAHRATGPPKSNYNRPIIIKLHNFSDKQRILAAARDKGELTYQGSKIHIRQDLSSQVREARRLFNRTCEQLIQRGIRFQMRYLASLCFTLNGKEHVFKSPDEAEKFLSGDGTN